MFYCLAYAALSVDWPVTNKRWCVEQPAGQCFPYWWSGNYGFIFCLVVSNALQTILPRLLAPSLRLFSASQILGAQDLIVAYKTRGGLRSFSFSILPFHPNISPAGLFASGKRGSCAGRSPSWLCRCNERQYQVLKQLSGLNWKSTHHHVPTQRTQESHVKGLNIPSKSCCFNCLFRDQCCLRFGCRALEPSPKSLKRRWLFDGCSLRRSKKCRLTSRANPRPARPPGRQFSATVRSEIIIDWGSVRENSRQPERLSHSVS